ncbi:MAG: SHOCT domain-containing protein [Metamycoplasmataceae bacterium]
MHENDIKTLKDFKVLNKKELKLMITNFILVFSILISSLALIHIPYAGPVIALILTIGSGIWAFVNFILWIILKVKQFGVYNEFSEEFKEKNPSLMIFLVLSIFFALIFVFVIKYTLPKENAAETKMTESSSNESETFETLAVKEEKPKTNSNSNNKKYEELKMLKELLDSGIITQQEFDDKKSKILETL